MLLKNVNLNNIQRVYGCKTTLADTQTHIQNDKSCLKATCHVTSHKPLQQHISHTDSLRD